jgi:hypothetical protein
MSHQDKHLVLCGVGIAMISAGLTDDLFSGLLIGIGATVLLFALGGLDLDEDGEQG